MHALTDRDLLTIWEKTLDKSLVEKCLVFLAMVYPEYDPKQVASFSIGERDARLLHVREKMFGSTLRNAGVCPACRERIEWEVPVSELQLQPIGQHTGQDDIVIVYDGHEMHFRLPNSEDFLNLSPMESNEDNVVAMIKRCVLHEAPTHPGTEDLSSDMIEVISNKFAELDPQADIMIKLSCPQCRHEWSSIFDIMLYIWTEIQERVHTIYREIITIARHFSWSENEILSLSPFRRQLYLRMIQS